MFYTVQVGEVAVMDRTIVNFEDKRNDDDDSKFNLPGIEISINVCFISSLMMFRNEFRNIRKLEQRKVLDRRVELR